MAFILPAALATGEAWGRSRELLAAGYHLEIVMASHDASRPNFSENTALSELMFIARKLKGGETPGDTLYVNLWHNPRTIYEALNIADRVREQITNGLDSSGIASVHAEVEKKKHSLLNREGKKLAELVQLPPQKGTGQWTGVQFAQGLTLKAAISLQQGTLDVPVQTPVELPLCALSALGTLGFDQRDIHDAFTVSETVLETGWSPYPAFWNHEADKVKSLFQSPNAWLNPRTSAAKGRPLKKAAPVAASAGRILLVERARTTTHRVLAVGFDENVLGNTWWTFKASLPLEQEKALLLWLNSTPSLLLMLSHRVTTEGVWMKIKKPQWAVMPVLDVRQLSPQTLDLLADAYDALCQQELKALAKLDDDPVRAEIDGALSKALGLPDMKKLRELLAREPGLTGKPVLTPRQKQAALLAEETEKDAAAQLQLI
jgi:hypothetical protein